MRGVPKALWVLALGALLVPAAVRGQQQATADSHSAAARELIELIDLKHMAVQAGEAALDAQVKGNPQLAPYADVMHTFLRKVFADADLAGEVAKLYEETFSEQELREIVAFYHTPTGQKTLTKMPELMQKGMAIGLAKVQEHNAELTEMMAARRRELEAKPSAKAEPVPGTKPPAD
jgi:hypothetical protein